MKPIVITASDGYIIYILGPFLADGKNNDAAILNSLLYNKESSLRKWLAPSDVFVVDLGFRDSVDLIKSLGSQSESPEFLPKGQKQHSAEEANLSNLVPKIKWTVESNRPMVG